MENQIYWNINKMLSYNALMYYVLGERGVGKSYGAKEYVATHFIKTGHQFVYLRRYKTELQEAMMKGNNPIFFDQVKNSKKLKEHTLTNRKDTMYIDKKLAGYAIPLSTANILKSATFEKVDTIIFDEFIIDKGSYHYLQNEVIQLLDIIETIARLRDIKIIFLGNAISITNPYFAFFNITLPYNSEFKICKKDNSGNPLIVINYIKNMKYREIKKSTRFGQLIDGTEYGKYAIDNEFLRDSKAFISKKTKESKFYFTIIINNKKYGVWVDYQNANMYISDDYDPLCPVIFSFNAEDHNEKTLLIRTRTSPFFKSVIEHYRLARLFFENQRLKNEVMNIISRFLTY